MDITAETGDLSRTLTIFTSVAIVVTTIAVLLRLYVRIFLIRRFAIDDYLMIACQACFLPAMYCMLKEVKLGLGKHFLQVIIHPGHVSEMIKFYFIANILFYGAITFVKLAIVSFFLYLCPPRGLRITAIVIAVLTILIGGLATLFHAFHCLPSAYYWNRWSPTAHATGHCVDPHTSYISEQVFNTLDMTSDFILAALPTIMVWNMKMSKSHKFGVSVLLGSGVLSAVSPLIRAFYLKALLVNSLDVSFHAAPVAMLSTAEVAIAITVVCIAQLRPLYRKLRGNWSTLDESTKPTVVTPTYGGGSKPTLRRNVTELTDIVEGEVAGS